MKKINILFVCKHNVFRSQVAEEFFNRLNKNKNYKAQSAGLISFKKEDLTNDKGYKVEKKIVKKFGLKFNGKSKKINSSVLKKTDILILVANNVHPSLFREEEPSFNGKVIVWKIPDVKIKEKNKAKVAENSIKKIEEKVKDFVKKLR